MQRRRSRAPGARNGRSSPEQPLGYLIAESFDRRTLARMDAALATGTRRGMQHMPQPYTPPRTIAPSG